MGEDNAAEVAEFDATAVGKSVAFAWCEGRAGIPQWMRDEFVTYYAEEEVSNHGYAVWDWPDCAVVWQEWCNGFAGLAD